MERNDNILKKMLAKKKLLDLKIFKKTKLFSIIACSRQISCVAILANVFFVT